MLTNLEQVAVSKATFPKAEKLAQGTHEVDCVVRLTGTISVGKEEQAKTYPKHDPAAMLAILLKGKTEDEIAEVVKQAKTADKSEIERVKTAANAAARKGRKPTISNKSGKTTTALIATRIEHLVAPPSATVAA